MKRTALKRGTKPLQRKTRLKPLSARGRERNAAFREARAKALGDNPTCRFPHVELALRQDVSVPCDAWRGLHAHHVELRSQNVARIADETNLVPLCGAAHRWTHEHPALAKELGLYGPEGDQ